ncbi:MAG: 4Fe-4S cluster-binding domain-containing protein [Synergistaceae bacterium]|nr:4Fe-4S cluster-binding domain-containing protein [Synergistaceae bacterium]
MLRRGTNAITGCGRVYIPFFVVITGQACSLKCRDCVNLTPYAPPHTMRYDILKILDTLRQILSLSVIDVLQIQGGEAFLYPNLAGLLEFVLENKAVKRVVIATNGTLMPNVGLDLLRNPKLSVRISAYEHLSRKSAELKQYLDSNNVTNNMYSFASGIGRVWKLKM